MKMLEITKFLGVGLIKFKNWKLFIPAKKETVIGGLDFLDDYILRAEKSDAIPKLVCKKYKN